MARLALVTATYNAAANLRHCLASVASQNLPVEHVVVDGGSTDGTVAIIDSHKRQIARYVSEPDQGIYDALNKGILMSTGDVIGILHSDDFYAGPDVLRKVMGVFDDPAVEACYGDLLYVDAKCDARCANRDKTRFIDQASDYRIVRYWRSASYDPRKFYWGWMPPHPTFFVRRAVYEQHGLFRLDLGTAADYELLLRFLLKHGITCQYIPEVLVCMRTGGMSNASFANRLRANRMDRLAWSINDIKPYPWTVLFKPLRKIPQYFFTSRGLVS